MTSSWVALRIKVALLRLASGHLVEGLSGHLVEEAICHSRTLAPLVDAMLSAAGEDAMTWMHAHAYFSLYGLGASTAFSREQSEGVRLYCRAASISAI